MAIKTEDRTDLPVPEPKKVILLAGNYAEHIREGGGVAALEVRRHAFFVELGELGGAARRVLAAGGRFFDGGGGCRD